MEEETLIELLRRRKALSNTPGQDCLDEAQVAGYVDGSLNERSRRDVEKHLANCKFCASQVAFLIRLEEEPLPTDVPLGLVANASQLPENRGRAGWLPVLRWGTVAGAAAASLLLIFSLILPDANRIQVTPPASPVGSEPEVLSSPASEPESGTPLQRRVRNQTRLSLRPDLLFPPEGRVVGQEKLEFQWKEVERTLFYEIRLVTAAGDIVWEDRVEGTRVRLPAEIELDDGAKYFVWVRAYLPEGKTIKSSTVGFRVSKNS